MAICFRLLGPVEADIDGQQVELGHARQRCVLAALLVDAGRVVSTDVLLDRVWTDQLPHRARSALSGYLSRLRRALPEVTLSHEPGGYRLDIDPMTVDLHRFRRLVTQARAEPHAAETLLTEALRLWRGDAFAHLETPWLNSIRTALDAERYAAELDRNDLALAGGRHAMLLAGLDASASEHPFDERLAGQLLLALYRCGRVADALYHYDEVRHRLAEDLGTDPSPALQQLHQRILAADPTLDGTPTGGSPVPADTSGVLEREHEIAELADAAREAVAGKGSVVLVSGEPGIGKSCLVDAMRGVLPPESRLLVGYCDDLATPRTLGPFRDLIGSVGPRLTAALRAGDNRDEVLDALRAELADRPTILAVEDLHWADEATLDALSYMVRRVAGLPVMLVLTFRDDDLSRGYPLQRLLGYAGRTPRVRRLELAPLSEAAVEQLAAQYQHDPHEVFAVTRGNPLFVTEVLASGQADRVPPTVVDAVLTRVHRLDPAIRTTVEQLAVVPSTVERRLLDVLLPNGIIDVAAAEQCGLLTVSPTRAGFNHELARRAIADSLPVARRVQLNRQVLAALIEQQDSDLPQLVHHAAQAGDAAAIIRYGPQAATEAIRAGSHREAAAHLRLVLEHKQRLEPQERADLLGSYAVESYTIGDMDAAVSAAQEAVDLRRTLGDMRALGADLRFLSRTCWAAMQPDLMESSADEAVAVLTDAGDDRLLAFALSHKSHLHLYGERHHGAVHIGERAVALARAAGDPAILSHALTNVGSAKWRLGLPEGRPILEESVRVALSAGAVEEACRAYCHIIENLLADLSHSEASQYIEAALELAEGTEHLAYLSLFHADRASLGLATGDWDQAMSDAELAGAGFCPPVTGQIMVAQGRIQVRRGQPGGDLLLAEASQVALRSREVKAIGVVAAARAEAAWLRGDYAAVPSLVESAYADACRLGIVALRAELGYWLTMSGHPVPPDASSHPYALSMAGEWQEAAAAWRKADCPYEYAAALADSTDPADLQDALTTLDTLGARPLANHVRARLRRINVRATS